MRDTLETSLGKPKTDLVQRLKKLELLGKEKEYFQNLNKTNLP